MGIIRVLSSAIGGGLADSWLEVFEADDMSDNTVMAKGVAVRSSSKRNRNIKGEPKAVSNGSIIHVYPNQFMMLIEGGKVVDYTAEEGYYKVDNSTLPSLFNGELADSIKETFRRVKYGGTQPSAQTVVFINLQEIKGIKFGTKNPINYFDSFYNSELFLRAHGTYSIKITDPLKFYFEAIPKNKDRVDIQEINDQYLAEFLSAFQAAINRMSAEGQKISFVTSKSMEISKYMSEVLDDDWKETRGFEVKSVGIASISYDEESQRLINMRNQGAMMSDPSIREGYVQGSVARGIEAAGSNAAGSMAGFMGVGLGMNATGGFMAEASRSNQAQMEKMNEKANNANLWTCPSCNIQNEGKFCTNCGKQRPAANGWVCSCGTSNEGNFCTNCGKAKPSKDFKCAECGYEIKDASAEVRFCPNCGKPNNKE
ncbi:MAG: SPFH domain-containing protein [Acutalibacteraceae bacterium]|jgi:membrane protease subunit (stomatin/prohibitin family)